MPLRSAERDLGTVLRKSWWRTSDDHKAGYVTGRLSNNTVVHFPGDESLIGKIVDVWLAGVQRILLHGKASGRTGELNRGWIITNDGTNTWRPKKQYSDCILFYRLGDFYEMFFDDALTASKELELTLTGKECGLEERAPMCGVPYHAVDSYLSRSGAEGIQGCHRGADGGSEAGKGAGKA